MLKVIKFGGKLLENEASLRAVATAVARTLPRTIVVHGGGVMATRLAEKLSIEQHIVDGRRITDAATLDITVMAYAGLANKRLTAALAAQGAQACGLTGCDMGVVRSTKRPVQQDIDWGFVGDVQQVNDKALRMLLNSGYTPVLSPITYSAEGLLLNTNADSVAAAVAAAMSREEEVELVYCFDKAGVLRDINDPDSVIPEIDEQLYAELKREGAIFEGMLPKLENAFATLRKGVSRVRITAPDSLTGGTVIKL